MDNLLFLENDLESIIFENSKSNEGRKLLRKRGLCISLYGTMHRQVKLDKYGIADLININKDGNIFFVDLYELKKDSINLSTLTQVCRYATALVKILNELNLKFYLRIILIGKNIDYNDDFVYICNFLLCHDINCIVLNTYEFNINGISFKSYVSYEQPNFEIRNDTISNNILQFKELFDMSDEDNMIEKDPNQNWE